jgi:hypothetical protein
MNTEPDLHQRSGCTWGQWLSLWMFVACTIWIAVWPLFPRAASRAGMMQAVNNARQIVIVMKNYAGDHEGRYPGDLGDTASSNDAFRELFRMDLGLLDERIFTSPKSPFIGDDVIGDAPGYTDALKPGENHWAMVRGMRDDGDGRVALVFDNPATGVAWPPRWNMDIAGQSEPGRGWASGKVVIARNDNSSQGEQLTATRGSAVGLKDEVLFPAEHPGRSILDVARK